VGAIEADLSTTEEVGAVEADGSAAEEVGVEGVEADGVAAEEVGTVETDGSAAAAPAVNRSGRAAASARPTTRLSIGRAATRTAVLATRPAVDASGDWRSPSAAPARVD